MRHNVDGRKFGRNTSHRIALFANLANAVLDKEQIVTTVEKAKEARRVVDRLITLGKEGSLHSKRLAFDRTRDRQIVKKLFSTLAERYRARAGGYTRVLKITERRWGDAAEMAVLELVDHPEIDRRRKRKPKPMSKKEEAAQSSGGAATSKEATAKLAEKPGSFKSRFGKFFGSKSKVSDTGGKGGRGFFGGSARKTPAAGGGGSKTGGSSG